jgi:hypothetical protein
VRQERFARVCLPNIVIARLVESIRVPIESAGAQRGDSARHGIAAHVDHFRPNVLAVLRANRVRFKSFTYDELTKRDKLKLDIFWLKDESLEDSANLPDPDVIAQEIVEDLEAALQQFATIAADLKR